MIRAREPVTNLTATCSPPVRPDRADKGRVQVRPLRNPIPRPGGQKRKRKAEERVDEWEEEQKRDMDDNFGVDGLVIRHGYWVGGWVRISLNGWMFHYIHAQTPLSKLGGRMDGREAHAAMPV